MVTVGKRVTVVCLDCELPIELSYEPVEGQIITCPQCEVELEVINTDPLEIDFYFEDWNNDDELDEAAEEEEDEDWGDED